jgi:hypothetical protein
MKTAVEFVSYELALRMKQLGFDEPCFAWYVTESYGLEYGKVIKSDLIKDGIVAPTFSQAFRWFREKYKLSGIPQYFTGGFYCYTINDMKDTKESNKLFTEFETYEEAELACLEKLIEIKQTFKSK